VQNRHRKGGDLVSKKLGKTIVSGFALAFAICVAASANATVYYASSSATPCGTPNYPTIQDAINHASAGSTVGICAGQGSNPDGSYPEQVYINKRLTLEGIAVGNVNQAVITAPIGGVVTNANSLIDGSAIQAQIYVTDTTAVDITNVVVDGTGNGLATCAAFLVGIYYQDASGVVSHVVARHQEAADLTDYGGCQWGLGIYAESGQISGKSGTSTLTVEYASVHDFMKNGITGNEVGTSLNVIDSQIRGQGPTTGAAENGIQFGFGAKGEAVNNSVSDVVWSPCVSLSNCEATGTGILLYDSSNVTVSANHVANTQGAVGIDADGEFFCVGGTNQGASCTGAGDSTCTGTGAACTPASANDETVENNVVNGSLVYDAIDVCGSNDSAVTGNTISNSGQSAIHLDSTCSLFGGPVGGSASVSGNIINEACAGILDGSANNTIGTNTSNNVVSTTLSADSATCTVPSGGDVVGKTDSGQKNARLHAVRP
jgi:hypothetical protein